MMMMMIPKQNMKFLSSRWSENLQWKTLPGYWYFQLQSLNSFRAWTSSDIFVDISEIVIHPCLPCLQLSKGPVQCPVFTFATTVGARVECTLELQLPGVERVQIQYFIFIIFIIFITFIIFIIIVPITITINDASLSTSPSSFMFIKQYKITAPQFLSFSIKELFDLQTVYFVHTRYRNYIQVPPL